MKRRIGLSGVYVKLEGNTGRFSEAHKKCVDSGCELKVLRDFEHDMPTKVAAQLIEWERCGAYDLNAFALRSGTRHSFLEARFKPSLFRVPSPESRAAKRIPDLASKEIRLLLIVGSDDNVHERAVGRVMEFLSAFFFVFEETEKIVLLGKSNTRVFRHPGLHDHAPGLHPAASAPCELRQQLERAFAGAEIRKPEAHIRQNHTHERHVREIESLGDHLRADQNVDLLLPKSFQDLFVGIFFLSSVRIHPRDTGAREKPGDLAFDLFCAKPHKA